MVEFKALNKMAIQRPYQKVANQLLKEIVDGKYGIGARIPSERQLAEKFNVGRPVIREAIIALEILGVVAVKPNSGIYVIPRQKTSPSNDVDLDVGGFELLEARLLIEGEIAYLAATVLTDAAHAELDNIMLQMRAANDRGEIEQAEICDDRFHEIIVKHISNSALHGIITELNIAHNRSPLAKRLFARIHGKGVGRRIEEHEAILDALKARDAVGARAAMRRHLGCVLAELAAANELETAAPYQQEKQQDGSVETDSVKRSILRTTVR